MTVWVAFLRGVNLGNRQMKMAELRAAFLEGAARQLDLLGRARCDMMLVQFLQREHPESLPRVRAELQPLVAGLDRG